jgi:peptidyl-prolyl cis-trans isomerase SurA
MTDFRSAWRPFLAAMVLGLVAGHAFAEGGDYIVAIVNQEVVTAAELQQRIAQAREDAARLKLPLPPANVLRKEALDALIDERVLVTNARDTGNKIDPSELDRAVSSIAAQNQLTVPQLHDRLKAEGIDYPKFRDSVKDKMLIERVREREVANRIKVSDAEIDELISQRLAGAGADAQFNVAQILIGVPEGAGVSAVSERRDRALAALRRVRGGEDFATVAREMSDDGNRAKGGEIGMRPADRLPDVFVKVVRPLKVGEIAPDLLRTAAGFHILKLVDRREVGAFTVQQVHARHILLRLSPEVTTEAATRRLVQFKRDIMAGKSTFEQLARVNSEDASSEQGGDLGWASPGQFVPEFEEAIAHLEVGGISDPVATRFGLHLIQLIERRDVTLDRKQQRDQARNILREKKFEGAYAEWLRDLRGEAYIELRDAPQ